MLCPTCPRATELNSLGGGTRGPRTSLLACLGTGPGADELAQTSAFTGASGRILTRAMLESNLNPSEVFYFNRCNCPERGGTKKRLTVYNVVIPKGTSLDAEQLAACGDRYHADLNSLTNCRLLVALGAEAFTAATGIHEPISKYQNHPLHRDELTSPLRCEWVLPLYHPAYIAYRGMKDYGTLLAGFATARAILDGTYRKITIGENVPYKQATTWIKRTEPIAFDIENEIDTGIITQIGLALCTDPPQSTSLPWDPATRILTKALLSRPGRTKIAHNAAHDIKYLALAGVTIADPVFDTMWAHQMLNPELEKGLNAVAGMMLQSQAWKHTSKTDPVGYNLSDVHFTALLYPRLLEGLHKDGMDTLFIERVMPALRTLIRLSATGLRVDPKRLDAWRDTLKQEVEKGLNRIHTLVGRPINPNSTKQLQNLLYGDWGLPTKTPRAGKITTNEDALKTLTTFTRGKRKWTVAHDTLGELLHFRSRSKMLSTYAGMHGTTVHPSYFPVGKDSDKYGTATGRLTSSEPHIQHQPPEARVIYVPHEKGNLLLEADYSQIELRVIGALARDERLMGAFARGLDVHEETRSGLGIRDRRPAKAVNYGSAYYIGARKLLGVLRLQGIKSSLSECEGMLARFVELYPQLAGWRESLVDRVEAVGFVRSPFGRRRYFYRPRSVAPEVVNHPIQSTVADIIIDRLPTTETLFLKYGGRLLTTVHDSFLGEVPRPAWRALATELKDALERPFDEVAPGWYCPVDLKVGVRWGWMHKVRVDDTGHRH